MIALRPRLPRILAQYVSGLPAGRALAPGKGAHWKGKDPNEAVGTVGGVKHPRLRYRGPSGFFLKLESTGLHPVIKFGTKPVSSSFVPTGSPPMIGVNGWPVLALNR